MAEQEAQDSESLPKDVKEEAQDIESQINSAMLSRVGHFKEQADSLTFEGVRRLLEKDLGMEIYTLDVHKRFIKQLLLKCIEGANDEDDSKNSGEAKEESVRGNAAELPEGHQPKKDVKESFSEDEDKMEDSPVLGLLTGHKTNKSETDGSKGNTKRKAPSESTIKSALVKRAPYITANSDKVTMADLRRLLEEDLGLKKNTLDPYKKFISQQLDRVLNSSEVSEPASNAKKSVVKKNSQKTVPKKARIVESSDSSDTESDEEEDELKIRKKRAPKGKMQNFDGVKKRKTPSKDLNISGKKRIKSAEAMKENHSDAEDGGSVSEDGNSQSSAEKPTKKEVSAPAYGKRVESLKSVIKACGMSVPPAIYKKVKQVPENKREDQLIKELEEILAKEGLSANPSEKEIKEVRKKKERAKELEGIDTSNIVSSSRRRSTTGFVAPPKPKIPIESDDGDTDDDEDDDDDDDEDDDDDDDDDDDNDHNEDNGNSDDSQSEESNEDDDDSE
ncbi:uncharacterized protein LOC107404639 isoform X2 [Ziziphus jujuba]|uniref:Uncharacterized protein LOC107404639 isoform X2 n=1 Tax=Ziziphus jujuba TaxID=326968 RepID=A0A9B4AM08_ZIZJJ|nr:uncharacterized protein LOC107404639 isoform X2 [Ziziphus jujuba]